MRVSLFITCYNDTLFPGTGQAVVRVLERLGHTVDFRPAQTCCGQMHYNTGYQREALPLMRHSLEVFHGAAVICIPSSSCVAMIRDHYPKAWTTVLFGGGVKGGRIIGKTDAEGAGVVERPITATDFMATICTALGIDYNKQNDSGIGRPIRIVESSQPLLADSHAVQHLIARL